MAFVHGSDSYISVDGTNVSTYTDSVTHVDGVSTANVSAFGNDDEAFIAGLKAGRVGLSGHWDPTADAAYSGTFDGAVVEIIYGPEGNTSGDVSYTANYLVTSYQVSSPVADKVSWSADFQRTGALTRSTF